MKNFLLSDWGPAFRAAAGRVAYMLACVIVAAEIAYRAGLATGRAVHRLSDLLAGLASGRIDRAETARAVVSWAHAVLDAPAPAPAPVTDVWRARADQNLPVASAAEHEWRKATPEATPKATPEATAWQPIGAQPVVMACAPAATPPVAVAAPPFEALTVAQLRKLARARGLSKLARNGKRSDLIAALV